MSRNMDLSNLLCMEGQWMRKRCVSKLFASNSNVRIDETFIEFTLAQAHPMSDLRKVT